LTVAGALVAVGATRSAALAMPLELVDATAGDGSKRTYGIPATDGAQIDKQNQVILVRWENAVYAFDLSCPHQNTALKWDERDRQFQCPKHHSKYRPDGGFIDGRATRGMDRFAISRDGNGITVDVEKLYQEDENPAEWAAAVVKLAK
jgi:Rieske Fe-S protein